MVYRVHLTYDEIIDRLDLEYIPSKRTAFSLNPGIYEINDINKTLEYLIPDNVKVTITIDDIRIKSNLKINQTLIFTEKSFFLTILGFVQSNSGEFGCINGFIQLIPGSFKSDKPININGIDKIHLKCHSVNGRIVNGIWNQFCTRLLLAHLRVIKYTTNWQSNFLIE